MAIKDVKNAKRKTSSSKPFTYYDALAGKEVTVQRTTSYYDARSGKNQTIGSNGVSANPIARPSSFRSQLANEKDSAYKKAMEEASSLSAAQATRLQQQRARSQDIRNNPNAALQSLMDQYDQTMSMLAKGNYDPSYALERSKHLVDTSKDLSAQLTMAGMNNDEIREFLKAIEDGSRMTFLSPNAGTMQMMNTLSDEERREYLMQNPVDAYNYQYIESLNPADQNEVWKSATYAQQGNKLDPNAGTMQMMNYMTPEDKKEYQYSNQGNQLNADAGSLSMLNTLSPEEQIEYLNQHDPIMAAHRDAAYKETELGRLEMERREWISKLEGDASNAAMAGQYQMLNTLSPEDREEYLLNNSGHYGKYVADKVAELDKQIAAIKKDTELATQNAALISNPFFQYVLENPTQALLNAVNTGNAENAEMAWQYLYYNDSAQAMAAAEKAIEALKSRRWTLTQQNIDLFDREANDARDIQISEINQQINAWEAKKNLATYQMEGERMGDVAKEGSESYDPNFETASQYVEPAELKSNAQKIYAYLNGDAARREELTRINSSYNPSTQQTVAPEYFDQLDYLNETEVQLFNYYYNKDPEEGMRYLELMRETLSNREASELFKQYEDKVLAEVFYGAAAGMQQYTQGVKNTVVGYFGGDIYIPQTAGQQLGGMIRQDLSDDGRIIATGAYDALSSATNMAPSVLVGMAFGPVAGKAAMGVSIAGNAYQEAVNSGFTPGQARNYANLITASELALQELVGGIGQLSGANNVTQKLLTSTLSKIDNAMARVAVQLSANSMGEFTDEYLQEIIAPVIRNIAFDERNKPKAFTEEALYNGIMGALTSIPFSFLPGGEDSFSYLKNVANLENAVAGANMGKVADVIAEAKQINNQSAFLPRVEKQMEKGGAESVSKRDLGNLVIENAMAQMEQAAKELDRAPRVDTVDKHGTAKTDAGETVTVRELGYKDGGVIIKVADENGAERNVSRSTLELSDDVADLIDLASKYGSAAPAVYAAFENSMDFNQYARDVDTIIAMAQSSVSRSGEKALNWLLNNQHIKMHPKAIETLFAAGREMTIAKQPLIKRGSGKVTFADGIDRSKLDERRAAQVAFLEDFAALTGIEIEFFESTAYNGKYLGEQGSYKSNRIRLDLNAGLYNTTDDIVRVAITRTASHEVTHWLKDVAPEEYRNLRDFVIEKMIDEGGSTLEDLIDSKKRRARGTLTVDDAIDEIVADGAELVLGNSKYIREYAKRNQKGFVTIKNWLVNFLGNIKNAFADVDSVHEESSVLMEKYADELISLWDTAFEAGMKNVNAAAETISETAKVKDDIVAVSAAKIGIDVDTATESVAPAEVHSERDPLTEEIVRLESQIARLERKASEAFLAGQMRTARQAGKEVREQIEKAERKQENLEAQIKKLKSESRSNLKEMREKLAALKKQDAQRLRDYRANRNESDAVKKYRKRIESRVKDLQDLLFTNTDKKHIPEPLKEPLARFLDDLMPQMYSRSLYEKGEGTNRDAVIQNTMRKLGEVITKQTAAQNGMNDGEFNFDGYLDLPAEMAEEFSKLQDAFGKIAANANIDEPIYQLSSADLQRLDWFLSTLKHSINRMNQLLSAPKQSVLDAAKSTIDETSKLGEAKVRGKFGTTAASFLNWDNATPFYVFKRLGEGGKTIFNAIASGWDKLAFNSKAVIDFSEETYTSKEVKNWTQEVHDFELSSGETVRMTDAQLMALYCLSNRPQAMSHLLGGGIRVANIEKGKNKIQQSEPRLLTIGDIEMLIESLTDRQRSVADKIQRFMTEQGSKWGNEVSMARFGYRAFTEETYFPIVSDQNNFAAIDPEARANDLFRLLNISATKALTPNANNAIVIEDIFNVYANHMSDMAKYNALALPVLDAFKWLNYKEEAKLESGQKETVTVQRALEKAYGKKAQNYLVTFLKDLNAAHSGGRRDSGFFNVLSSNAKVASVAANVRVALLQPTAYLKAALLMNPKWLAAGAALTSKQHKAAVAEMKKHSGIALWKSLGFYDTNISRSITAQIKNDESLKDKIVDKSMFLAEKADEITWGYLWNACKREVLATKHLHDDALLDATAERFREIVYATQVVDSTLTRSHLMRDKDGPSKLYTSFMSEPTLAYNMVLDQYNEFMRVYRETGSKGRALNDTYKGMLRATGVYATTAIATALVEALTDIMREDEEKYKVWEKAFWNKYLHYGHDNAIDNLNPFSMIPMLRDLVSVLQGFAIERQDMAWATDLVNGIMSLIEIIQLKSGKLDTPTKLTYYGNMTGYGAVYKLLQGISGLTGLPIGAGIRELQTIWNNSVGLVREDLIWKTYDAGDETDIRSAYENGYITAEEAQRRFEGIGMKPNDAYWEVQKMGGTDEEALLSAALISGTGFDEAAQTLVDHGYQLKDVRSKVSTLAKKWLQGKHSSSGKAYKGHRVTEAEAVELLVKYGNESKDDAEKKVKKWSMYLKTGWDYTEIEELLISGEISEAKAIELITTYGSKDKSEAEMTVQGYLWRDENQAYSDLSDQKIDRYITYCKPAGISVEEFYEAATMAADMKKDDTVDMILDLGLTDKQEEAMWNAIKQTKWKNTDTPWE